MDVLTRYKDRLVQLAERLVAEETIEQEEFERCSPTFRMPGRTRTSRRRRSTARSPGAHPRNRQPARHRRRSRLHSPRSARLDRPAKGRRERSRRPRLVRRSHRRRTPGRLPGAAPHPQHRHALGARCGHRSDGASSSPTASRRLASSTSRFRRPAGIPWSTPTGCTPRAHRPRWSTPTTTFSRSIRSISGMRPPFDPVVEDGRVYARGASDDKCHINLHLWAREDVARDPRPTAAEPARSSSRARKNRGSDHFEPWIVANRERLAADLAIISDTGFYEGNQPAITVGLRGLVYTQIDVTGSQARPSFGDLRRQRAEPGECAGQHPRALEER